MRWLAADGIPDGHLVHQAFIALLVIVAVGAASAIVSDWCKRLYGWLDYKLAMRELRKKP